ncbi:hypothetical protein HRbin30_01469 [bacterium HR30]|nr:hypothetical protein HRbin30_01469 [bacterium HR30]
MTVNAVSERPLKRVRRAVVGILLWGLGLLPLVLTGPNAAQARTAIVTGTEWVFIRRGPGNQFPPFARVPSGSTVEVQEIRDDWAQIITASGQVGFIHVRFLSFPDELGRAPAPTTPRATPTAPSGGPPTPLPPEDSPGFPATVHPVPSAVPTKLSTPTRTAKATRTPPPTRTSTSTRTHTPTRSPSPTRTTSPTRTPTPTAFAGTGIPAGTAATVRSGATVTATPTSVEEATQRLRELEAELLATRQALALCRQQTPSLASCPQELREELVRLRSLLEREPRGDDASTKSFNEEAGAPTPPTNSSLDNHVVTPLAVFLGFLGLIIGWFSGTRYGRRSERMRRWRLQVK